MDSVNLDRFFATIGAELNAYNKFKRQIAPTLAPDFNLFSCLWLDESRLSRVIAMLLDPNGEHGQGATFLNLFLDDIKAEGCWKDTLELIRRGIETHCTKVYREFTTENNRRIDILLDFGTVGLAIENKPWAGDLDKQLEAYIQDLDERFTKGFLLIYLSGNGQDPAEHSLKEANREERKKSGQFLTVGYFSLREWINRCKEKCRSNRVRSFLEDFESYVTLEFSGGLKDMIENIVIEQATKKENIAAAYAIGYAWPDITKKLIDDLTKLVWRRMESNHGSWIIENKFAFYDKTGIIFYKQGWSKYRIGFHFDGKCARELFYGVKRGTYRGPDENDKRLVVNLERIGKMGGVSNENWWVWRQHFDAPYRDWSSSAEPWAGICENGKTVDVVASMLERIIECVADDIDRIEGVRNPDSQSVPV